MNVNWIVLFDWDGTLINSLDIKIRNAGILFSQSLNISPQLVAEAYRHYSGVPRRQLFDVICVNNGMSPLSEEQFMGLNQEFSRANLAALENVNLHEVVSEDTRKTLQTLVDLGFTMYVSSASDTQEIRHLANSFRLDQFFCEILGSAPGFNKGKQHVEYILKAQRAELFQLIMVGDEPADIYLGKEAGIITVAKAGTYSVEQLKGIAPDYIISSLKELPALLKRLQYDKRKVKIT